MSRLPRYYDADLAAAGALALAGLVVTVAPVPDPLRAVLFLPVVLFLPGYLLAAVLFPPGVITRVERAVLVCAFTVAVWAIGGLLIQLAVGLDRTAWLALLMTLTAVAVPAAQARRLGRTRPYPRRPRLAMRRLIPIPVALIVAAIAIGIASSSADSQLARSHFSVVWIVPSGSPTTGVAVGVENHEGRDVRYELRVSQAGTTLSHWKFSLDDHETWERRLGLHRITGKRPVVAALFRNGSLYRRTALDPEASG